MQRTNLNDKAEFDNFLVVLDLLEDNPDLVKQHIAANIQLVSDQARLTLLLQNINTDLYQEAITLFNNNKKRSAHPNPAEGNDSSFFKRAPRQPDFDDDAQRKMEVYGLM